MDNKEFMIIYFVSFIVVGSLVFAVSAMVRDPMPPATPTQPGYKINPIDYNEVYKQCCVYIKKIRANRAYTKDGNYMRDLAFERFEKKLAKEKDLSYKDYVKNVENLDKDYLIAKDAFYKDHLAYVNKIENELYLDYVEESQIVYDSYTDYYMANIDIVALNEGIIELCTKLLTWITG